MGTSQLFRMFRRCVPPILQCVPHTFTEHLCTKSSTAPRERGLARSSMTPATLRVTAFILCCPGMAQAHQGRWRARKSCRAHSLSLDFFVHNTRFVPTQNVKSRWSEYVSTQDPRWHGHQAQLFLVWVVGWETACRSRRREGCAGCVANCLSRLVFRILFKQTHDRGVFSLDEPSTPAALLRHHERSMHEPTAAKVLG